MTTSSTHTSHARGGRAAAAAARLRSGQGFSVLELLMVIFIAGTVTGIAIGIMPSITRSLKGDSITQQLNGFLRNAREQAIAQRRNIQIATAGDSSLATTVVNVAVAEDEEETSDLGTVDLEGGFEFLRFEEVPDTPDFFGAGAAFTFSGPPPYAFTSEGSFVDGNGDPSNGTLFIGKTDEPTTAAAVTIFGPTAQVRTWKWNGAQWAQ